MPLPLGKTWLPLFLSPKALLSESQNVIARHNHTPTTNSVELLSYHRGTDAMLYRAVSGSQE